jgi:RND family efflux transporter MFP subunit
LARCGLACIALLAAGQVQSQAPVVVARAERAPVNEQLNLTGTAVARRISRLSPKVDALVAEVLVDDGDAVQTGQVLLRLDAVIANMELNSAAAALEEAKAQLKDARRRRDESAELAGQNLVAESVYAGAIAEVEIRAAAVKRLEADLARQREIVARHMVTAPFAGVIAQKQVEVGQWVQRGTPVLELVEIDVLRIEVPVPQAYFQRVQVGTPVKVRFDARPGRVQDAAVSFRIPVSDPAARTFPVRIELDNRSGQQAPGMSARVAFLLGDGGSQVVLQLPRDALVRQRDGTHLVWIVNESGSGWVATAVTVLPGRNVGDRVEVTNEIITNGARVVVRGNENLRDGQQVSIVEDTG